jgi:ATP-binding cassette subfamily B protein
MALMSSLIAQDVSYFDEHHTTVIPSRISEDITNASDTYSIHLIQFARVVFQWFSGLVIDLLTSVQVTPITLLRLPLSSAAQFMGKRIDATLWPSYNERCTPVSVKAEEVHTSLQTIRACDTEMGEYGTYKARLVDVHEVVVKTALVHGLKEWVSSLARWGMVSVVPYCICVQAAEQITDLRSNCGI